MTSNKYFCLYDKQKEIEEHNKLLPHSLKLEVPSQPLTRIEARLRPYTPVTEIENLANPFGKVIVTSLKSTTKLKWYLNLALDHGRLVGINGVLPKLPENARKKLTDALKEHSSNWWVPTEIWSKYKTQAAIILDPWNKNI